jgi:hypothetical protein
MGMTHLPQIAGQFLIILAQITVAVKTAALRDKLIVNYIVGAQRANFKRLKFPSFNKLCTERNLLRGYTRSL